jgi:hypothetical protein
VAALAGDARPSDDLLDWFGRHRADELQWQQTDTPALVRLLRRSDPKSWRFLDITGVLDRALPEVASAMQRRRADISDLDPIGALRFQVVDRLDDLAVELDLPSDRLVIAALVADVCADVADDTDSAYRLASRLVPETEATRIASIVTDAHTLRAGTALRSRFDEADVMQMAAHLASASHAHDAYSLALALGPLPRWHREALDERLAMISEALAHPELAGGEAGNLASAHRLAAEHLLAGARADDRDGESPADDHDQRAAIDRLRSASISYLLSHSPEELARHALLVEPLPRRGAVRVSVSPDPEPDHWRLDIACRDADGLLAHLTETLTREGLDTVSASIATWPDGAVLDSFLVIGHYRPSARELARAIETELTRPLRPAPMPELSLRFDHRAHPWHSLCTVQGPDRPGALHAVSAAFATADVVVHSARISSSGSTVNDQFWVSDRLGHKLDAPAVERVGRALAGQRSRRRFARR